MDSVIIPNNKMREAWGLVLDAFEDITNGCVPPDMGNRNEFLVACRLAGTWAEEAEIANGVEAIDGMIRSQPRSKMAELSVTDYIHNRIRGG